jgi:hypothetical protein
MNKFPGDAANSTTPRPGDPVPGAAPGGLKRMLKVAVPIVVLMAVIFGVTFFSQYTRKPEEEKKQEPPLRFFSSTRQWDPPNLEWDYPYPDAQARFPKPYRGLPLLAPTLDPSRYDPFIFSAQDRAFPGFFETRADVAGSRNTTSYWFENRNPQGVTMRHRKASCDACSGARVTPVPPEVARQLLEMACVTGLPQGPLGGFSLGMVGPAANLAPDRLNAKAVAFKDDPHPTFHVPGANNPDGWTPQWGILDLQFAVGATGVKEISSEFDVQLDGTKNASITKFTLRFEGVEAFELTTQPLHRLDVGELTENTEPRRYNVVIFSSTRGPNGNDLVDPKVDVRLPAALGGGNPDEFVIASTPVRVPQDELPFLAQDVTRGLKRPVKMEAAYLFTITVRPRVGDKRADLGPLDRDVWVSVPDYTTREPIRVRGVMRGGVWLDADRSSIDLRYSYSTGLADQPFTLITERRDAGLEVVHTECEPAFLKQPANLKLERLPPASDRGSYSLKISVPGQSETKPWNGVLVLEVKGPNPQRIRIPVKGNPER